MLASSGAASSMAGEPRSRYPGSLVKTRAESHMRWRRIDAPGYEEARIQRTTSGWNLSGVVDAVDAGVAALFHYQIQCDLEWRTRSAVVQGEAGGSLIRFALTADGMGNWASDTMPLSHLSGALDVDLGFSPATNTLTIRRLDLAEGESASVRAAWLRFPELRFEPLEQSYTRVSELTFRYSALADGELFSARLDTDGFGWVLTYEGLWVAEPAAPHGEKAEEGRYG